MASGGDARLLQSTKFPHEFKQKVDMQKVNLQVMKKWIATRISQLLGTEDDVVIELCVNLLEGSRYPDIKSLQIQLTGFLDKDTASFCKELWILLLSAQKSPQGVPKELLEAKKLELMQEKMEADRAAQNARRTRDDIPEKQHRNPRQDTDSLQAPGRRGARGYDNHGRGSHFSTKSRSPSPLPRSQSMRQPYGHDTYVPRQRRGPDRHSRWARDRSPHFSSSRRHPSMSRSPPQRRLRRDISPRRNISSRQRSLHKRDRSPANDGRYYSRGYPERDHSFAYRGSSSLSPERRSPQPKRRRYSRSPGSPVRRGRRRSPSASRSRSTLRSRSRTPVYSEDGSHCSRSYGSNDSERSYGQTPRQRSAGAKDRHDSSVKQERGRRKSSSLHRSERDNSPRVARDHFSKSCEPHQKDTTGTVTSPRRDRSADDLKDEQTTNSVTSQEPKASVMRDDQMSDNLLLKEKLLKEKLMHQRSYKMRSSDD